MRKIFESPPYKWNKTNSSVAVYKIDNDEYEEIKSMTHSELCAICSIREFDRGAFGGFFQKAEFDIRENFLTLYKTCGMRNYA